MSHDDHECHITTHKCHTTTHECHTMTHKSHITTHECHTWSEASPAQRCGFCPQAHAQPWSRRGHKKPSSVHCVCVAVNGDPQCKLFVCVTCFICRVGQNRVSAPYTVYDRMWWNPCQKYRMYTVYTYKCMVLANPIYMSLQTSLAAGEGTQLHQGLVMLL